MEMAAVDPARNIQAEAHSDILDKMTIRELLDNWVIWRDAGDWERFATVWHEDGRMVATWCQVSAADFIAGCRKGFEAGIIALHSLGAKTIELKESRAVTQSKMQIVQRARVHDILVDVTCQGRFIDALEKRDGRWGIVLRQPIYELDRIIALDAQATPELDSDLLRSFPEGYRHLAYVQTKMGFTVNKSLPGTRGPEVQSLYGRMRRWLDGEPATCLDA